MSANETETPPLLVTEAVAARMLSISPRKLFDMRKRGQVRAVRLGKSVRYDPRKLLEDVENGRNDGKRDE